MLPPAAIAVSIVPLYFPVKNVLSMYMTGRQCWKASMHAPRPKRGAAIPACLVSEHKDMFSSRRNFQNSSGIWCATVMADYDTRLHMHLTASPTSGVARIFAWGMPNQSIYMRTVKNPFSNLVKFQKNTQQFRTQLLSGIISLKL